MITNQEPEWLAEIREKSERQKIDWCHYDGSDLPSARHDRASLLAYVDRLREALEPIAWMAEILPDEHCVVTKRFEWIEPLRVKTSSGGVQTEYDRQLNGVPFFRAKQALAWKPEGLG